MLRRTRPTARRVCGRSETAAALVLMNETSGDAERSLYIDGVNGGDEYEYDGEFHLQPGTALALPVLVASGVPCEVDPAERAERPHRRYVRHDRRGGVPLPVPPHHISHGDGDGGLFTGISCATLARRHPAAAQ